MIYTLDGFLLQNHEGILKGQDKFIDCRVKIKREQVIFVLKLRKGLYTFFFTGKDKLTVEIVCLSVF